MDTDYGLLLVSSIQKAIYIHYKQFETNKKTYNMKIKEKNILGKIVAQKLNQGGHKDKRGKKGKELGRRERGRKERENRHLS